MLVSIRRTIFAQVTIESTYVSEEVVVEVSVPGMAPALESALWVLVLLVVEKEWAHGLDLAPGMGGLVLEATC